MTAEDTQVNDLRNFQGLFGRLGGQDDFRLEIVHTDYYLRCTRSSRVVILRAEEVPDSGADQVEVRVGREVFRYNYNVGYFTRADYSVVRAQELIYRIMEYLNGN